MGIRKSITLSMSEITRAFSAYKKSHGELALESELTFPMELQFKDDLAGIISEFEFTRYDAQQYNSAFIKMMERGRDNTGFIYDASVYNRYSRPLRHMDNIPNSTLQIGPGGSLGCEVLFALSGVQKAYTLDPFLILTFDLEGFIESLKVLFETMSLFQGIGNFDSSFLNFPELKILGTGHYRIGKSTVRHFDSRSFNCTGFENASVDYLFSHATMEHVIDPLHCIRETKRVLKPGGLTAHCIDLRDHRNFDVPLGFLRESREAWEEIMQEYCSIVPHGYMNRWRASEYKEAFEHEGFEVLEDVAEMKVSDAMIDAELPLVDDKYKSFEREDLRTTTLFIVARKV
ncbi:MAG: methyltransferase domain-containing protein [Nitrospiraceae bacterium]|nr:MAG: methyltransferase domain-containing protein [Nitrospiraceae bacterium]